MSRVTVSAECTARVSNANRLQFREAFLDIGRISTDCRGIRRLVLRRDHMCFTTPPKPPSRAQRRIPVCQRLVRPISLFCSRSLKRHLWAVSYVTELLMVNRVTGTEPTIGCRRSSGLLRPVLCLVFDLNDVLLSCLLLPYVF